MRTALVKLVLLWLLAFGLLVISAYYRAALLVFFLLLFWIRRSAPPFQETVKAQKIRNQMFILMGTITIIFLILALLNVYFPFPVLFKTIGVCVFLQCLPVFWPVSIIC